jgi:hypothetical protein
MKREQNLASAGTGLKPARYLLATLLIIMPLVTTVPSSHAMAGHIERLAQYIASVDLAAAAVRCRDGGVPSRQAKQAIASTDTTDAQLKEAIAIAHGSEPLTPDQASRKILQDCLEPE